jgi:hypothetical protein
MLIGTVVAAGCVELERQPVSQIALATAPHRQVAIKYLPGLDMVLCP